MAKSKTYEMMLKIGGKADSSLKAACGAADKNLSELGATAKNIGKAAAVGLAAAGAAVVAGGKALYDLGAGFDGAYDAIRIGTGATGEALTDLQGSMKKVYQSVPTEMDNAAKAIADYNTRLGVTGPVLEELSKQAIQTSDMLGDDLDAVITNSSQAFQQWNVAEENMADGMDHIFKVSQSTGMGFSDLMGDMQQYGAQLQEMGYGFEESSVLIGQMEKAGVNVPEVLGAMKKSVTAMAKEGLSATDGMSKYYDSIKNAEDATEAINIASEVFGTRAASTMAAAIRDGSMDVDGLTDALTASTETIGLAANDTYDLAEKWQLFRNRMDVALEPVATTVFDTIGGAVAGMMPMVEQFIPKLVEGVQTIIEKLTGAAAWVVENKDMLFALAGTIVAVVAAYKIAKTILVAYNGIMAIYKVACAASATGTLTLAGAMTALNWPVLAVTAAILAVVAIVVLLVKNWDWVKATALNVWNAIKGAWNAAADWFGTQVITPLVNFFSGLVTAVSGFFGDLWAGIKGIWNTVATWFKSSVITPLVNFFTPIIRTVSGIFSGCWILIQAAWKAASTWFHTNVVTPVVNTFHTVVDTVSGFFTGLWDSVVAAWTAAGTWFSTNVVTPVVNTFHTVVDAVGGFFTGLWDSIVSVWTAAGTWFGENVATPIMNAFQAVSDFAKGIFNGLIGIVEGLINRVITGINGLVGGFGNIVGKAAEFLGIDWGGIALLPQVTLPRLATGGIVTAPTILEAGEGGEPEAILPLSKLAALLGKGDKKPKGGGGPDPTPEHGGDGQGDPGDGGDGFTLAPVFHFHGPASKKDVEEAMKMGLAEFKRLHKQMEAETRRKAFSPA